MTAHFNRRRFLLASGTGLAAAAALNLGRAADARRSQQTPAAPQPDSELQQLIESHRPSRRGQLPADFARRVGATHVAGKYHRSSKPFLIEGAEKLLALGTRLGKFWLTPASIAQSYPFNSRWGTYRNCLELIRSEPFQQLLGLPFATLIFETHTPVEEGWKRPDRPDSFYQAVTDEFYQLTKQLYQTCHARDLTIVLQHWEGDWLLRGSGQTWDPPPPDWRALCQRMQRWLAARQAGVNKARSEYGVSARCLVAHAAEVNRVGDSARGIPTMTRHVLPGVELDLVSYSCYDALRDGVRLFQSIEEIRQQARTGPVFGPRAVYVGEIGIPENEQPKRLSERWDEFLGALLAARVEFIVHWELYCNEFKTGLASKPKTPVKNPELLRGFWLVKPDGSLSVSGRYLTQLWRAAA